MSTNVYDVIIVGGGFAGLAAAYHLAGRGAKTLLLEAKGLASGASGACAGRAQVSESPRGLHLSMALAGLKRLESLEEELEFEFEWRRLGNLILIYDEDKLLWWREQVALLQQEGLEATMLEADELGEVEPHLQAEGCLAAAWALEGHLNPFKFARAYARAAQERGADIRAYSSVTGFESNAGRIAAVRVGDERFATGAVLVAAGAWTGRVLSMAGAWLPVQFTHAEAMISERLPQTLHNHVGLADFYETIHAHSRAVSVGAAQQKSGALLITEAVEQSETIHRRNSTWGMAGMARDFLGLFPDLANIRIVRGWAIASPFLPDEQPAIGLMPGFENLFVATCFLLTITTIPLLSEWIAALILGDPVPPGLHLYSPARYVRESG
ncbi:MAG: FAD-binding oxidoreductase [Chloroflexi bacterium]|nr:FAD-binding oxidoreductase [Chloroflexota bacterium]